MTTAPTPARARFSIERTYAASIDEAWAREYAAKGFRLMGYGVDQLLLQDALRNGLDVLRDAFDNAKADKGLPK